MYSYSEQTNQSILMYNQTCTMYVPYRNCIHTLTYITVYYLFVPLNLSAYTCAYKKWDISSSLYDQAGVQRLIRQSLPSSTTAVIIFTVVLWGHGRNEYSPNDGVYTNRRIICISDVAEKIKTNEKNPKNCRGKKYGTQTVPTNVNHFKR